MASVHFRTNILLKSVIGKDLITDDNVAVLELVKNSFDANSEGVSIVFRNIEDNDDAHAPPSPTDFTSKLLIRDTGTGMTLSDIQNKWLNIAYSEKKAIREEFGRILAGNKGVGRFSCDRLGRYLDIYTKKAESDTYLHLTIDWQRFEVANRIDLNIQDIKLTTNDIPAEAFESLTGHPAFDHGTLLEISQLREKWAYDKIISLKRQLERLINPNQAFKNNPFFIEIEAVDYQDADLKREEYFRVNGRVFNRIFENLNFKTSSIYSEINTAKKTITTTLSHKGQEVFKLVEKNPFASLEDADIKLNVYYLSTYSKAYFTRQTGIRSVDFGSIYLFMNGFRIPPYGDVGDDWLGIDMRKNQGYARYLASREVVGRIEVNDDKDKFKIISSRTGVVNSPAFEELTRQASPYGYFFKAFRRLERFVVEGIAFDSSIYGSQAEDQVLRAGDNWDESQEAYTEDDLTKNKRILTIIRKIIDIRASEIVSLKIDESFVEELVQEQLNTAREEIDKITSELMNRKLSEYELMSLRDRLSEQLQQINQLQVSVADNAGMRADAQGIDTDIQTLINHLTKEVADLKEQLAKQEVEQQRRDAEHAAEKKRLEDELEAEARENLFSKRLVGKDIKEVISLQHHIDGAAQYINASIKDLILNIENEGPRRTSLDLVNKISMETRKISTISKFVTNANFNLDVAVIKKDLNRFIREYILNVYQESDLLRYNNLLLPLDLESDKVVFKCAFRPLEIVMLIDNLFSNARRAESKHLWVTLSVTPENKLKFTFADDGVGIPEANLSRIFTLGFTTTSGSGIGLYHVKQIVTKAKGTIEVESKQAKGTTFKILIPTTL
jgi:signal transduction histidine kinase